MLLKLAQGVGATSLEAGEQSTHPSSSESVANRTFFFTEPEVDMLVVVVCFAASPLGSRHTFGAIREVR